MTDDRELLLANAVAEFLAKGDSEALTQMIERDSDARDELVLQIALDAWLRAVRAPSIDVDRVMRALPLRGHVPSNVMRRVRSHKPRSRLAWFAAAAALIMAVFILAQQSGKNPDSITIIERHGDVSGDVTALILGTDGQASVVAEDGTRVEVSGQSRMHAITYGDNRGLTLALDSGHIRVSTPKRSVDRPLRIETPTASLTVLGTLFTVDVDAFGTVLAVAEGKVRFRAAGGDERVVAAGERADTKPRTVVLAAVEDCLVNDGHPDTNVPNQDHLPLRGENSQRLALLRFRLPTGNVRKATLILTLLNGEGPITARRVNGPWTETTTTWANQPHRGDDLGVLQPDTDGRLCLDVTAACGAGTCELMLSAPGEYDTTIASREAATGQPVLEVTLAK